MRALGLLLILISVLTLTSGNAVADSSNETARLSDQIFGISDRPMRDVGAGARYSAEEGFSVVIRARALAWGKRLDPKQSPHHLDGILMLARIQAEAAVGQGGLPGFRIEFTPISYGDQLGSDEFGASAALASALPVVYSRDIALDTEHQVEIAALQGQWTLTTYTPTTPSLQNLPVFLVRVAVNALGYRFASFADGGAFSGLELGRLNVEMGLVFSTSTRLVLGFDASAGLGRYKGESGFTAVTSEAYTELWTSLNQLVSLFARVSGKSTSVFNAMGTVQDGGDAQATVGVSFHFQ